jgi:hypothetical protein
VGFIQRVQDRVASQQDFSNFKRLWPAYKLVDSVGVARPKVYLTVPKPEMAQVAWGTLKTRIPNLFTMRPTMFSSRSHDFMMRDDGMRGLMNFSWRNMQAPMDAIQQQTSFLDGMPDDTGMLLEEFPLTHDNVLCYPTHYQVHAFGGVVGCIQGFTRDHNFWMSEECRVLGSANDRDVSELVPNVGVMDDFCSAAKAISMATELPYIRVDFVSSTQGAMFRSFAYTPGDVVSEGHNWFYKQNDEQLGQLWSQAEQVLSPAKDEDIANVSSEKPREAPVAAPNDNA